MLKKKILLIASVMSALTLRAAEAGADYSRIYLASRPSVSPNGKKFVFEWCDTIWIASTKGGQARPLEMTPFKDAWPIFSQDGDFVAFQSNRNGGWKMFTHNLDSGQVKQITDHSQSSTPHCWMKDGKSIISTVLRDDPGTYRYNRIASIPVELKKAESVLFDTYGDEPALSPDEKRLLFTREGISIYRKGVCGAKASQIWMCDLETKKFTEIIKRLKDARTPLWTPDGGGFYYVGGQDGAMNIWHRELKSGQERQITFFKEDSVIHPSLSRDGSTMIFRHLFDFYVIDPKKSVKNPEKLTLWPSQRPTRPNYRQRYYNSCWNNDEDGAVSFCDFGMQVAFTTGGDLFVMDTNLREPICVHGDSLTHERGCAFSKDGQTLYYISDHGDGSALWKAECVETNKFWWENIKFKKTILLNDETHRSALRVSPDNSMLCWVEPVGTLVITDTNCVVKARHKSAGGVGGVAWSPDSRWLAATMTDNYGNSDIQILSADGTTEPYNVSRHFSWDGHPCWSSDGKIVVYIGARERRQRKIFYVYLNPDDEKFVRRAKKIEEARNAIREERGRKKKDGKTQNGADKSVNIVFENLHSRVRSIELSNAKNISTPFFSQKNPATLAFGATIDGVKGTWKISIPDNLKPSKMTGRTGASPEWIAKDDKLLWIHDRKPALFNKSIPFNVYQNTDIADYQELGFLSAWGRLRDWFYDPNYHGVDWNAVKKKYRLAARHAPVYSVYARVLHLLNGELRASHLGFNATEASKKEWDIEIKSHSWKMRTGHLGLLYDQSHTAAGWLVKSVVPDGPADKKGSGIKAGDIVLRINRNPVNPRTDPASVLNGHANAPVFVEIKSATNAVRALSIIPASYKEVHELRTEQLYLNRRAIVKERSGNKFGYLHIARMQWENYYKFEQEIFAEGFDKEGMVIDVRDNLGGFTADHIINILCGMNHSVSIMRDAEPAYLSGYWGRPVFDKPIVVLCNQNTGSNGEIFTHAIKTLKRGKIVGVTTSGAVIATSDHNLLDLGKLRLPHRGWFLPDGRNMDFNGARPDVEIWNTPEDEINAKDRQLEKAVEVLKESVTRFRKAHPPFKPLHHRVE